jgi:hypothetical protein
MLFRSPAPFVLALTCLLLFSVPVIADDWRTIDPADLALKAPLVEKDADAEAIFWEVRVDDSQSSELSLKHYIRIKVFTERGRESQSKVDLPYLSSTSIKDIAARVIKADGSIVELKKDDVLERTIVKASGLKIKAKSFALSGVEPGSIIEYRWREVFPGASANHLRMQFQRGIPVEAVNYYFKPFAGMRYLPFHMGDGKFVKDKDGFFKFTMVNMPAFHEEARMPPEDEVRAWVFLFFSDASKLEPDTYWKNYGKAIFEATKDDMKVGDEVKKAVAGIVGDATTPEAKLERIYDFCRTKIKNVSHDSAGMSEEEKKKFKPSKSPSETLQRSMGSGSNIDMLFAALAKAAGFDARLALSGNRDDLFFDKGLANSYFLASSFIAVHVGENWKYFSPAEMYTSFDMLGWPEEGQDTLITDAKEPLWVKTPISPPEKSLEKRTGKLRLLEDGTLEGDLRIEYTGHLGFDKKQQNHNESAGQREEDLRESVKKRLSTAEISDIKIENATDPIKPFAYAYHIRIPGYAQRTGKRLFLQPAFFQHGLGPLFSSSDRKNPLYFHYPWSEDDHLEIALPAGFALDNADTPAPIPRAMTQNVCELKITIGVTSGSPALIYDRKFFFGGEASIIFPAKSYRALKQLFDLVNQADDHAITLKQAATSN